MKFIHLNCLRKWIRQRVVINDTQNVTRIFWKNLTCELCKSPYPFSVYFNGQIHELVMINTPMPPYMILDCFIKNKDESDGIAIINFIQNSIVTIVI